MNETYGWLCRRGGYTLNDNSTTTYPDNTADGSLGVVAPPFGTAPGIVAGNLHAFPKGQSGQDADKAPLQIYYGTTGSGASVASTAAGLWANIGVKNQNNNPGAPIAGQRVAEYWYFMSVADDAINNKAQRQRIDRDHDTRVVGYADRPDNTQDLSRRIYGTAANVLAVPDVSKAAVGGAPYDGDLAFSR